VERGPENTDTAPSKKTHLKEIQMNTVSSGMIGCGDVTELKSGPDF